MTHTDKELVALTTRIREIVREEIALALGKPVAPKPEHVAGEICTAPLNKSSLSKQELNDTFKFTGEIRRATGNEYILMDGEICQFNAAIGSLSLNPYWILTREPKPAPTWHPGDYAYCTFSAAIARITTASPDGYIRCEPIERPIVGWTGSGGAISYRLRTLTPADWTRELGGVKVRAYETQEGFVRFMYTDKSPEIPKWLYGKNGEKISREFCRLAGLPIMPWDACVKLQGGEFLAPEESK